MEGEDKTSWWWWHGPCKEMMSFPPGVGIEAQRKESSVSHLLVIYVVEPRCMPCEYNSELPSQPCVLHSWSSSKKLFSLLCQHLIFYKFSFPSLSLCAAPVSVPGRRNAFLCICIVCRQHGAWYTLGVNKSLTNEEQLQLAWGCLEGDLRPLAVIGLVTIQLLQITVRKSG